MLFGILYIGVLVFLIVYFLDRILLSAILDDILYMSLTFLCSKREIAGV